MSIIYRRPVEHTQDLENYIENPNFDSGGVDEQRSRRKTLMDCVAGLYLVYLGVRYPGGL